MKKYRNNAGSDIRLLYGTELIAGLEGFDDTKPLAEPLQALNDELEAVHEARQVKAKDRRKVRARLRAAEYAVDASIRQIASAAETKDGGRRGATFRALFPDNVTAVISASGSRQIAPAEKFEQRFAQSTVAGLDELRERYLPKLSTSIAKLKEINDQYQQIRQDLAGIRVKENLLREDHLEQVERTMGLVRAAFPRDRSLRRVIFPVGPSRSRGSSDSEDEDESDDDLDES